MCNVRSILFDELRISHLYYTGEKGILHAVGEPEIDEIVNDIDALMTEDTYSDNSFRRIEYLSPVFCEVLKKLKIETIMIVRIGRKEEREGYLICAETKSLRRRVTQQIICVQDKLQVDTFSPFNQQCPCERSRVLKGRQTDEILVIRILTQLVNKLSIRKAQPRL